MANTKKKVTMSVPEGMEFNTSYTLADLHMREKHSKHYYDTDRNIDKFKESFETKLLKVTKEITDLLITKNQAYGDTALNPIKIFSRLDASEAICARLDDKIMRIKNKGINDETEDTVSDLIGYLLLLKMSMK
tara:strand:+ start:226 stop:624 length:399 start_codon:yes stop_codon:yes gene_type:complete